LFFGIFTAVKISKGGRIKDVIVNNKSNLDFISQMSTFLFKILVKTHFVRIFVDGCQILSNQFWNIPLE
jgi:hypothetical protein